MVVQTGVAFKILLNLEYILRFVKKIIGKEIATKVQSYSCRQIFMAKFIEC